MTTEKLAAMFVGIAWLRQHVEKLKAIAPRVPLHGTYSKYAATLRQLSTREKQAWNEYMESRDALAQLCNKLKVDFKSTGYEEKLWPTLK